MPDLDARLLAAHEQRDALALVALYTEAADNTADDDAAAFYLTHAWIWALDCDAASLPTLQSRLLALGRL